MSTAKKSAPMRSALGRVRHLGSAKEGVQHWWAQRLTALALVPLTLWFVASVAWLAGADHAGFTGWVARPHNALLMILLLARDVANRSDSIADLRGHGIAGVALGLLVVAGLAAGRYAMETWLGLPAGPI